jgi:hypothetical protein
MASMRTTMKLVVALALSLAAAGCAQGPLGSHGVDYIPAFEGGCESC